MCKIKHVRDIVMRKRFWCSKIFQGNEFTDFSFMNYDREVFGNLGKLFVILCTCVIAKSNPVHCHVEQRVTGVQNPTSLTVSC